MPPIDPHTEPRRVDLPFVGPPPPAGGLPNTRREAGPEPSAAGRDPRAFDPDPDPEADPRLDLAPEPEPAEREGDPSDEEAALDLYTLGEAARLAGISEQALRKRVRRGTVATTHAERQGRRVVAIAREELLRHYPYATGAGVLSAASEGLAGGSSDAATSALRSALGAELERFGARLSQDQERLAAERDRLAAAAAEAAAARRDVARAEESLGRLEHERDLERERAESRTAELGRARERVATLERELTELRERLTAAEPGSLRRAASVASFVVLAMIVGVVLTAQYAAREQARGARELQERVVGWLQGQEAPADAPDAGER